jgi:exopolyphosphatase/guanosine-5'-triphosphate,3'-diphosphate pyrophosphatase
MRAAVLDVGANTARVVVFERAARRPRAIYEEGTPLGLGAEIERDGTLSPEALARAEAAARRHAETARKLGAGTFEVLVTSPARQASNGADLVAALSAGSRASVRALSASEEAALAFRGAVVSTPGVRGVVAVCDVGGGSTQVVVGTLDRVDWWRSLDLGSLRLARRAFVADPPGQAGLAAARREVEAAFRDVAPPCPDTALATGGTARALRRIAGDRLGAGELAQALAVLGECPSARVSRSYGVGEERARTLPAGAVILASLADRLGALRIARGGLREGAVTLAVTEQAAA